MVEWNARMRAKEIALAVCAKLDVPLGEAGIGTGRSVCIMYYAAHKARYPKTGDTRWYPLVELVIQRKAYQIPANKGVGVACAKAKSLLNKHLMV